MSMSQILQSLIANVKVVAATLGTLGVLIGAVLAVESRYALAQRTDKEFEELQLAMDESRIQTQLEAQQLILDLNLKGTTESIQDLQSKKLEKGTLDQWETNRLKRLEEQRDLDRQKLERLEQFRLEHKM